MNPEIYQDGHCQLCRLTGVFDGQAGVLLQKAVKDALNAGGNGRLVLECSGVDWADAAGCRQLVQLNSMMADRGGLVLAAVSAPLKQVFEDQGCDHLFEMAVSLPAATHSAAPPLIPSARVPSAATSLPQGPPPAPDWASNPIPGPPGFPAMASNWESPPPATGWDSVSSTPSTPIPVIPAASMAANLNPPAVSSDWGAGWENVNPSTQSKKAKNPKVQGKGFPWKPLLFTGGALLSAVVGYLLFLQFRSPLISVNQASVKGEYGNAVDVVISVEHGVLSKVSREAIEKIVGGEEGLTNPGNAPEEDDKSIVKYNVTGKLLSRPGKNSIKLMAERGSQTSESKTLEIEVLPAAFTRPSASESYRMEAGKEIDLSTTDLVQIYLIAENAYKVEAEDPAMLPAGVTIKKFGVDEKSGVNSWVLTGVPEKEGIYKVNLGFDAPNLEDMKKKGRIEIEVTPSKSKPPEEVNPQESAVTSNPPVAGQVADSHGVSPTHQKIAVSTSLETSSGGQTESTGGEIDDRLRGFLLNRVRKSPFSVEQKKSIEESIDKLRIGVHLFTAQFESSSALFTDKSKEGLEKALTEKPDLFQKFEGELEFIIIGYASLPGTAPKNKALSIQRANAVAQTLRDRYKVSLAVGYGATDVVGASSAENQVVEVFVGVPPKDDKARNLLDKLRNYIKQSYGRE